MTSTGLLLGGCPLEEEEPGGAGGADASVEGGSAAGTCTHPETGEADTEVQCLVDPCSTASCDGDPEATCEANYCGGCHAIFTAADGTPADCDPIACTADAMICPDGSGVGRDPENGCQFFPCPGDDVACTEDAKLCPDGTALSRDPANDCQFPACPGEDLVCTADVKECPDGSFVSRDPENDCQFELCPGECLNPETGEPDTLVDCFADPCSVNTCDAHPDAQCTANYCGGCHAIFTDEAGNELSCEPVFCTQDAMECPDGSFVGRDPANDCAFFPCP